MHNITVITRVLRPDSSLMWEDCMRWYGVDDEVRAWLAQSCRVTAVDLASYPETISAGYTIQYRTQVDGRDPTDTGLLDFANVDYPGVVRFQRWAIHELGEMLTLLESKHTRPNAQTKYRSKTRMFANLAWQWFTR